MNDLHVQTDLELAFWQQTAQVARFVAHELGNQQVSQNYLQTMSAQAADKLHKLTLAMQAQADRLAVEQITAALTVLHENYVYKVAAQAENTATMAQALLAMQGFFAAYNRPMLLQQMSLADLLNDVLAVFRIKAERAGFSLQVQDFPDVSLVTQPAPLARGVMVLLQTAMAQHWGARAQPPEPISLVLVADNAKGQLIIRCGYVGAEAEVSQPKFEAEDVCWLMDWLQHIGGSFKVLSSHGQQQLELTMPKDLSSRVGLG